MYIKWEGPLITINPHSGVDLEANHPNGVPVPNYGNYGGPLNSGGDPVDSIDALFKTHDEDIQAAIQLSEIVQAHAALFDAITGLEKSPEGLLIMHSPPNNLDEGYPDAEATLYAGFTLFALTAQVAQSDNGLALLDYYLDPLDPDNGVSLDDVSFALTKAAEYTETGLEAVPPNEIKGLHGLLNIWEHQFDTLIA